MVRTAVGIARHVKATHNGPLPRMIETLGEALKHNGFSFKRDRYALKSGATMPHSQNCYEDTIPALSYFFVNS